MDLPPEPADAQAALSHYRNLCASLSRQLEDANDDIKDFNESSKELQDELEKELARMEQSEKDMRRDLETARSEMDTWKSKYTAALREHTTTITHMQKELEALRTSEKTLRAKLRDMELDNDDLEKSEREKDSSLQDLESRYGRSIERIALLEEELVTKAQLEEEVQRLKDELRDLNEEMAVLKSQTTTVPAYPRATTPPPSAKLPDPITSDQARPLSESPPLSPSKAPSSPPDTPTLAVPKPAVARESPAPLAPLPSTGSGSGIARSSKTNNLFVASLSTPKAVRERRADGMIRDMKEMTERVKLLTSRLDSRRNLVMAGSGIPRASMSPGHAQTTFGPGLTRSVTKSRLNQSTIGRPRSRLGREGSMDDIKPPPLPNFSSAMGSTRPPSRGALRMSMGGAKSAIPVRPPSRLSAMGAGEELRPITPTYPSRSPTPSSSRPSSTLSSSQYPSSTTAAAHRRRTSSTFGYSAPTASSLAQSVNVNARASKPSGYSGLGVGTNGTTTAKESTATIARRASLALGRSAMRKPSGPAPTK